MEVLHDAKYCNDLYIATDHKPLCGIMCDRSLDSNDNPRLVWIKEKSLW